MIDFKIDENGEIDKEDICDNNNRFKYQIVTSKIKTIKGDWYGYPTLGCDIEKYIGMVAELSNTKMEKEIIDNITNNSFIGKETIYIEKIIGENKNEFGFCIYIKDELKEDVYKKIDVKLNNYY